MKHKLHYIYTFSLVLLFLTGCSKEPSQSGGFEGEENYKYFLLSALGSWPNTVHYMTGMNDVTTGMIDLNKEGDEINSKGTYAYIVKNGYIYNFKTDQGIFKKFKYSKDRLHTEKEVPFSYINDVYTFTWVDDNTLVLFGTTGDAQHLRYAVLSVNDLSIISKGEVEGLEKFPEGYNHLAMGVSSYIDGKIYLQYGFRNDKWIMPDFYNFAILDYPNFKVINKERDNRISGLTNGSPYFKTSFKKENEAFYYTCFPRTNASNTDVYMFRAKMGEESFDKSFEINLTKLVGGVKPETIIQYIEENKFIMVYRDQTLGKAYNARYIIVDIESKQIVRRLDELPADEPYEQAIFEENGKIFMAINSKEKQNFVWIYDVKTDKVTKGMEIPGNISGFARFDKFY